MNQLDRDFRVFATKFHEHDAPARLQGLADRLDDRKRVIALSRGILAEAHQCGCTRCWEYRAERQFSPTGFHSVWTALRNTMMCCWGKVLMVSTQSRG